jgi:hypothetical protein
MQTVDWRLEKPDEPGIWESRLGTSFARHVRYRVYRGADGRLYYTSTKNRSNPRPVEEIPDHSPRRWRGPLRDDA